MLLGVNIDHIAVLREARGVNDPDLFDALSVVKFAGADQITIHLREDRRHVNENDVSSIIKHSHLPINLECSINDDIINIANELKPQRITLVPENRQEITTEGGLDLEKNFDKINQIITKSNNNDIHVSLFIDPNEAATNLAIKLKPQWVEFHTGHFSNIYAHIFSNIKYTKYAIKELDIDKNSLTQMLYKSIDEIDLCSHLADEHDIFVAAGHGLNYQNVTHISQIHTISELNIGQSIIARSVFVGLKDAILQMKELI